MPLFRVTHLYFASFISITYDTGWFYGNSILKLATVVDKKSSCFHFVQQHLNAVPFAFHFRKALCVLTVLYMYVCLLASYAQPREPS